MKNFKMIVKVTVPRIVTDMPMAVFSTADGKWVKEVPVNQQIIKWMKGKHEGYFELTMNMLKILSMRPVEESKYAIQVASTES